MSILIVLLKGDQFDLEDLPELIATPELSVVVEDGRYCLRSRETNAFESPEEAKERAIALVRMLNGVLKFVREDFQEVTDDGLKVITDDGKSYSYSYLTVTTLRTKQKTMVTPVLHPTAVETLIEATKADRHVADALHFFKDGTWFNLYKAYEILRDAVGGEHKIVKNGWVPKRELSRFTQTAQSRAALGDLARHASKKYTPPANPMTLKEARNLVRAILAKWLDSKCPR